MRKLDFINERLKIYQDTYQNTYTIQDSLLIERLLQELKRLSFSGVLSFNHFTYISKEHTIILMRQFLACFSSSLEEKFSLLLKDKRIVFFPCSRGIHRAGYYQKVPFIKLSLTNTLEDFIVLVHEFFHLTNRSFSKCSYQMTRESLSEFISIYFEKQALTFLRERGYDERELSYFRLKRFEDTRRTIQRYHFENTIFKVYQKEKKINFSNTPYKIEKIYQYMKNYSFSPFKKMGYILGDVLSEYVMDLFLPPQKVLRLNDLIYEKTIFEALEELEITIDFFKISDLFFCYENSVFKLLSTFSQ